MIRCLNGVTPQFCSVGGGPSSGGDVPSLGDLFSSTPDTYTWVSLPSCSPPTTCVITPNYADPVCSFTRGPAPECAGSEHLGRPDCWRNYPVECVSGYPTSTSPSECNDVCVQGICALSSTPDPKCPDAAVLPYVDPFGAYCADGAPVACALGYDVAFDGGVWPGPVESTPPNPCATSSTHGGAPADSGGGD